MYRIEADTFILEFIPEISMKHCQEKQGWKSHIAFIITSNSLLKLAVI